MGSLDKIISEKFARLSAENLVRAPKTTERLQGARVIRNGKKLVSFSCNDYLGLSQDKRLKTAAIAATRRYGTGSGASRLITGNTPLYDILERSLAKLCRTEAALVYGSGYTANLGVITSLVGSGDLIVADKLSHSCIIEGSQLSGAELKRFLHNDMSSLENILIRSRKDHKNCLVITEAVFSMDGDGPDMKKLGSICRKYDAWLLIDYAHDITHLTSKKAKNPYESVIKMGTLSKGVGTYGGYIAGSRILIDFLKTSSKTFIFTTGLPAGVLGSSIRSLEVVKNEPWRVKKALDNAKYFREKLEKHLDELEIGDSSSQIIPMIIGGISDTVKISEYLYANGFLVSAIKPPTVPVNTSRLRFSFSAAHEKKDIDKLIKTLIRYFRK